MAGASKFFELANDFGRRIAQGGDRALRGLQGEEGEEFADDWADLRHATAGEHGKHYPNSITSETRVGLGIHVETGPDSSMPQGSMGRGFEFGAATNRPTSTASAPSRSLSAAWRGPPARLSEQVLP